MFLLEYSNVLKTYDRGRRAIVRTKKFNSEHSKFSVSELVKIYKNIKQLHY